MFLHDLRTQTVKKTFNSAFLFLFYSNIYHLWERRRARVSFRCTFFPLSDELVHIFLYFLSFFNLKESEIYRTISFSYLPLNMMMMKNENEHWSAIHFSYAFVCLLPDSMCMIRCSYNSTGWLHTEFKIQNGRHHRHPNENLFELHAASHARTVRFVAKLNHFTCILFVQLRRGIKNDYTWHGIQSGAFLFVPMALEWNGIIKNSMNWIWI